MMDIKPLLINLISQPGLSGYEAPVRALIAQAWRPLVEEISTSRLGNLNGLCRGNSAEPRPRLLLAAHMDAVGLMVSGIVDGFLRITSIGGLDAHILPGQQVLIHGRRVIPGIIVQLPDRLLPSEQAGKAVEFESLLVDSGLSPDEVVALIRVGDLISFDQHPFELENGVIVGHSLDNRASIAALTICLEELQHLGHAWDVWAVATVQEEETMAGAYTGSNQIVPQLAIAIDTTYARGAGVGDYRSFHLGKGITLGWGAEIHPVLHKAIRDIADRLNIPYSIEYLPVYSGTDANFMQVAVSGCPTMIISIPLRYMHSPLEMVSVEDITNAGHLLASFIAGLAADFTRNFTWNI
jgi:putative aminopeptidase FrvX